MGRVLHDLGFSPLKPRRTAPSKTRRQVAHKVAERGWPRINKKPPAGARSFHR
jgi:transposase